MARMEGDAIMCPMNPIAGPVRAIRSCVRLGPRGAWLLVALAWLAGGTGLVGPVMAEAPRIDAFGEPLPEHVLARIGPDRMVGELFHVALAATPDGHLVALQRRDGQLGFWDRNQNRFTSIARLDGEVRCMRFGPHGRRLAAVVRDDVTGELEIHIIHVPERRTLHRWPIELTGSDRTVTGQGVVLARSSDDRPRLAFSPDGNRLALTGDRVHVWDLVNAKPLATIDNPARPEIVIDLAFAGRADQLLLGLTDGTVRRADLATGEFDTLIDIRAQDAVPPNVAINALPPDASTDWQVFYRNGELQGGRRHVADSLHPEHRVLLAMEASADGRTLALSGTGGYLAVWDLEQRRLRHWLWPAEPRNPGHAIGVLAMDPAGQTLISGRTGSSRLRRWDLDTGNEAGLLHYGPAGEEGVGEAALALAAEARTLVFAGKTAGVSTTTYRIWIHGIERPEALFSQRPVTGTDHPGGPPLVFTPDSRFVMVSDERGRGIWHVASGRWLGRLGHEYHGKVLGWSPAGSLVLRDSQREPEPAQRLTAFVPLSGRQGWQATFPRGPVLLLAGGRRMVRARSGDGVMLFRFDPDETAWSVMLNLEFEQTVRAVVASPDAKSFALLLKRDDAPGHRVLVYDAQSGDHRGTVETEAAIVRRIALASGGGRVIIGEVGQITVWQFGHGPDSQREAEMTLPVKGRVIEMDISADGLLAASSAEDEGEIRLWELATGRALATLSPTGSNTAELLLFSPDGAVLANESFTSPMQLWDIRSLGELPETITPATATNEDLIGLLEAPEPGPAWAAMRVLTGRGDEAVTALAGRLEALRPSDTRIPALIRQLNDPDFHVREAAQEVLGREGIAARPALEQALTDPPSPEVENRARTLLQRLNEMEGPAPTAARLLATRGVRVLVWADTPAAVQSLRELADHAASEMVRRQAGLATSSPPPTSNPADWAILGSSESR